MSLAVDHKKRRSIVRGDQIHPGKPCGPCCLCLRDQPSYTHVVSMQQEQRLWLLKYEQPDPADCICRRCAENVRKHMGEESYVPVWKKSVEKVRQSCLVVTCENEGTKGSAFIPYSVISEVLECNMHQDAPKTLCDAHYKVVYNVWTASQSACSSCGRRPKRHERFTRKCPNPELISRMLNLETVIASNICKSCYDFHNQLLHQTSVESVQEDLELRIDDIKSDIMKLECAKQDFDEQMHTELAINKAAISVASQIACQRAVLLSTVYNQFICTFSKSTANSFTSRWFLSQLSRKLHPHIAFACRCRKIGTVIYRQGGDIHIFPGAY